MHLYRLGELTLYSLTDIPLSVFLLTVVIINVIYNNLLFR